jgi:glycosyltransferase involved in cell wall biosynthesis
LSNNNQLVDVCIITYNQDQFINECVTSTFNQNTQSNIKVHVYDDASSDQTFNRLKKLTPTSTNISLKISQNPRNLGVSENFHQAVKQTESEYIAILEGDDYWIDPCKLDLQIKAMEENPEASFCFTDVLVEKNGKRGDVHPNLGGKTRMFSAIDLADQTGSIAQTCTLLIRRKFLQDLPDWVLSSYTLDWCLQIFLANQGPAIYIPQVTAVYRLHDHGIWSKLSPHEGWRKNINFYEDIIEKFDKRKERERIKKRISSLIYEALELANVQFNSKEIQFWLKLKLLQNNLKIDSQIIQSLRLLFLSLKNKFFIH